MDDPESPLRFLDHTLCSLCQAIFQNRWELSSDLLKRGITVHPAFLHEPELLISLPSAVTASPRHLMPTKHHNVGRLKRLAQTCMVCAMILTKLQRSIHLEHSAPLLETATGFVTILKYCGSVIVYFLHQLQDGSFEEDIAASVDLRIFWLDANARPESAWKIPGRSPPQFFLLFQAHIYSK